MKNIVPRDTRYIPFTQQKSCCVPTSISIVMYKLGIPLVSQELLGYYLGLIISEDSKDLFYNPRTGRRPKSGYGTRINLKQYSPNNIFKKLKIPLNLTVHHIDKFRDKKEVISFVSKYTDNNKDILVCFNPGILNNNGKNGGHVCVVDKLYPRKNIVRIIDPSPEQPKWREVEIDNLINAMKKHPAGEGGFWELKKT